MDNRPYSMEQIVQQWSDRADTSENEATLALQLSERSSSDEESIRLKARADDLYREAKAARQVAGDIARAISKSGSSSHPESVKLASFEYAVAEFNSAQSSLNEIKATFAYEYKKTNDDLMTGKLYRAMEGLENPKSFYFANLNAPDCLDTPEVMNMMNGMSGLNWPEEFRPTVCEAQRRLLKYRRRLEYLKATYSALTPDQQSKHSHVFP